MGERDALSAPGVSAERSLTQAERAPRDHAAGEVRDARDPGGLEDRGAHRRAPPGLADHDHRAISRHLAGARAQIAERDVLGAVETAELAGQLRRLADVD